MNINPIGITNSFKKRTNEYLIETIPFSGEFNGNQMFHDVARYIFSTKLTSSLNELNNNFYNNYVNSMPNKSLFGFSFIKAPWRNSKTMDQDLKTRTLYFIDQLYKKILETNITSSTVNLSIAEKLSVILKFLNLINIKDYTHYKFDNLDLSNCIFINCQFVSTEFIDTNLQNSIFINCDFSYSRFYYKDLNKIKNTKFMFCKFGYFENCWFNEKTQPLPFIIDNNSDIANDLILKNFIKRQEENSLFQKNKIILNSKLNIFRQNGYSETKTNNCEIRLICPITYEIPVAENVCAIAENNTIIQLYDYQSLIQSLQINYKSPISQKPLLDIFYLLTATDVLKIIS